jgi:hypothetical protein
MDQLSGFVQSNSGWLGPVVLLAVLVGVVYLIYSYLYAARDPTYTLLLDGEAVARNPVKLTNDKVPRISTGTDFTLSMWFFIDDYNYRASQNKFLFALGPTLLGDNTQNVLVAALAPTTNDLMIRANARAASVTSPSPASMPAASGSAAPDITKELVLRSLMSQQTSMSMFQSTAGADALTPCDVRDVPLQRWVNLTVAVSGRTMDVYMDGKLTRSCVLDSVVSVPHGKLTLRLGDFGGFGGRVSYVQMWASQLTPDAIYGIYQMGPARAPTNLFQRLAKWLDLDVTFTGPAPGERAAAPVSQMTGDPFSSLYQTAQSDFASAEQYAKGMYARM